MTTTFNARTGTRIKNLMELISDALGVDIDLADSASFKAVLESRDGDSITLRVTPLDQGLAMTSSVISDGEIVLPASGAPDVDASSGTATLVASTVDVTVTTPAHSVAVPAGSTVYATVTTGAGKTKLLSAVRLSDTQIRISSPGSGYGAVLSSAGVNGTLVAGTKSDIALANVAGDLLAVKETTPGGAAADHFSVVRVDNSNVKVQAHDAAGALVAGNTSVVTAFNFAQPAHETSLVRWIVVRP